VYIPLGGNRVAPLRRIANLLIVWMLTGLWHGASWNFVLWGLYYGVLLIIEKYLLAGLLDRAPSWVRHVYSLILIGIGWVIFSNTDFGQLGEYLGNLVGIDTYGFANSTTWYYLRNNLVLLLIAIPCATPAVRDWLKRRSQRQPVAALAINLALLLVSVAYLVYGSYNPFLYFRF
jgi:alginate O-acetyltransferase complex protein AlgI